MWTCETMTLTTSGTALPLISSSDWRITFFLSFPELLTFCSENVTGQIFLRAQEWSDLVSTLYFKHAWLHGNAAHSTAGFMNDCLVFNERLLLCWSMILIMFTIFFAFMASWRCNLQWHIYFYIYFVLVSWRTSVCNLSQNAITLYTNVITWHFLHPVSFAT